MRNPKDRKIHAKMLEEEAKTLYKKAKCLIKRVELGEFNDEQMEKVEYAISQYLAGIQDLRQELILEKTLEL